MRSRHPGRAYKNYHHRVFVSLAYGAPVPAPGISRKSGQFPPERRSARFRGLVSVHLPTERLEALLPVLYAFDGQNIFNDAPSFCGGWYLHHAVSDLSRAGKTAPVLVGIDHGARAATMIPTRTAAIVSPTGASGPPPRSNSCSPASAGPTATRAARTRTCPRTGPRKRLTAARPGRPMSPWFSAMTTLPDRRHHPADRRWCVAFWSTAC